VASPDLVPVLDPFLGVPEALRQALEKRGFSQLTAVQSAVLATIAEGRDENRNLRISSQTGSGKTIALGIALAARVVAPAPDAPGPIALIITPTRELAAQVQAELSWLFESAPGVRVDVVTGGTDVRSEKVRLRAHPGGHARASARSHPQPRLECERGERGRARRSRSDARDGLSR
jgi:ATP-dependent RNA helicase DeaD